MIKPDCLHSVLQLAHTGTKARSRGVCQKCKKVVEWQTNLPVKGVEIVNA